MLQRLSVGGVRFALLSVFWCALENMVVVFQSRNLLANSIMDRKL
jgi:hypothetical protein